MTTEIEVAIKTAYEDGRVYRPSTICIDADRDAAEYTGRLLWEKMEMVRRHVQSSTLLVDLCCATGTHLLDLAHNADRALGIDFSEPFIEKARHDAEAGGLGHIDFKLGDAKDLPLADRSVGTLYSFSSLYVIPGVDDVIGEIARVLAPGGRCILDLGNAGSLNSYCVRHYTEWPPSFPLPLGEIRAMLDRHRLSVVEHRAFQILPLWADRPGWLRPLLHPAWTSLLAKRVGRRMLDEWLSNLPGLKNLA
ncbi:MAG: class I SAM-dependent methyltransferase, partial [Geminicoccaceae bacterium]